MIMARKAAKALPLLEPGDTVIQLGVAGVLFVGPDAEVRQHCAAIVAAYMQHMRARGRLVESYREACVRIELRAEAVAPIRATTPDGMRAKAEALLPLAEFGMASYGYRVLAASLARDVLGREAIQSWAPRSSSSGFRRPAPATEELTSPALATDDPRVQAARMIVKLAAILGVSLRPCLALAEAGIERPGN